MPYQPGEHLEVIRTDPETGQRYNYNTGNPITMPANQNPSVMYVTPEGRRITYAEAWSRIPPALRAKSLKKMAKYAEVYPGIVDTHINTAMEDFMVDYSVDEANFVAERIAPVLTVPKRSNVYFIRARGDQARINNPNLVRAPGAVATDAQQGFTTATYQTIKYGVRDFLPDEVAENADEVLQLTQAMTRFLNTLQRTAQDQRVISKLYSTSVVTNNGSFTSLTQGGTGTLGTASATNRYIAQALRGASNNVALTNLGLGANTVVMGPDVATRIQYSAEVAPQLVFDMGGKFLTQGGMAPAVSRSFGMPARYADMDVIVVPTVQNSAEKGLTDNLTFLADNNHILVHYIEGPGRQTRNTMTIFRFGAWKVKTYRDESRNGFFIEVNVDQIESLTNPYGAFLITDPGVST